MASLTLLISFLSLVQSLYGYSGKVLIVSFDGFRWDYLNNIEGLTNFEKLAQDGVKAPYMNNTFTTKTFPNHYSIATGLYQESHGIVDNSMYDPLFDAWFSAGNIETRWWDGGEPVWITAVKQGKRSGAFHWAGSEAELQGLYPTFYSKYDQSTPWSLRVDTMMKWFTGNTTQEGIDVGLLYYHEPDETGHYHGPYSNEMERKVQEVDGFLGYLIEQIESAGMSDQLNLIVTSDHGMDEASINRVVDLYDYISSSDVEVVVNEECLCAILPKDGKEDDIVRALSSAHPSLKVYRKKDLPEQWHYTEHRRILPVVVVMDEDWQCVANLSSNPWLPLMLGNHGWDNSNMNMKPIFLAKGPDFKTGYDAPVLNNVDIYPLVCHLLGLEAAPNNGSLDNTLTLLRESKKDIYDDMEKYLKELYTNTASSFQQIHWFLLLFYACFKLWYE